MVKSAYCLLSTWSHQRKGDSSNKRPTDQEDEKGSTKLGQKPNGKGFFLKKSFVLNRLFSLITLLKHLSRLYPDLIEWPQATELLKPHITRTSKDRGYTLPNDNCENSVLHD